MGASKKSPSQKCADLFINIKSIKNKAKVFTFHCTFCSLACDQLKKFSKHLETHLEYFQNQLENAADNPFFETEEIKKELILPDQFNGEGESDAGDHKPLLEFDDPLKPEKVDIAEFALTQPIKSEENYGEEKGNDLESSRVMTSNHDMKVEESAEIVNEFNPNLLVLNSSDDSLDYSSDPNFDVRKELNASKNLKKSKYSIAKKKPVTIKRTKSTEKNETDAGNDSLCNKSKEKAPIVASILPFLIQQYKKYETLWQIDDIAFGIKIKRYEIFAKIAEAIKLEENKVISLDDLSYHIKYLNDLYTKDKRQELKCKIKKVDFVPEYEHYKEMSFLSKSQGPFLCPICNEIQSRYHVYCRHLAQHNNTLPYKCPICDSTFNKYNKFIVHKKRHLGILDFYCKICGKGYMFQNDLKFHVTSHTGDKQYLCQICGTGFRAHHGYYNHMRRHEKRFRHECHICKRGFNQLHALNSHVKSHLNIRDVICNICGKGFVHSQYLKRHQRRIHEKRPKEIKSKKKMK